MINQPPTIPVRFSLEAPKQNGIAPVRTQIFIDGFISILFGSTCPGDLHIGTKAESEIFGRKFSHTCRFRTSEIIAIQPGTPIRSLSNTLRAV
jgi:hypothetical protein